MTTIREALTLAKGDIGKVAKKERNQQQGFNFRGVDAVVNACAPAFEKHGILITPHLDAERVEAFATGKDKQMFRAVVTVTYTFTGPGGDTLSATVPGEAADSLDKAMSKAMSVAYRTCLIQTLSLPTGDPDPDSFNPPAQQTVEASDRSRLTQAKAKVWKLAQDRGWNTARLADHYRETTSQVISDATASALYAYARTLEIRPVEDVQLPEPPADWEPTP